MTDDSSFPLLANAPITEALIDFQVRSHEPITTKKLQSVARAVKDEFPLLEKRVQGTFSFNVKQQEASSSIDEEPYGFVVRTEDRHYAIQILRDRFTFSRLSPYVDWNDLRAQTERIWAIYREHVNCDRVVRLAVRYINRMLLPVPVDFGDYFTKPIEIPDGLPQEVANFMMRSVVPEPELGLVATIQQAMESVTPEEAAIIFDIDAVKVVDLAADNDEEMWLSLEKLREYKNRIFFKSLTEKAIALYQ